MWCFVLGGSWKDVPIKTVARYNRAEIRSSPDTLYVFGDNMARAGKGGQARECRGEPNAVGVPTKWRPTMEGGFFSDADLEAVKPDIQVAFRRLAAHLENGGWVVWPRDGVGTGLARLYEKAPDIGAFVDRCEAELRRRCAS
jgi:hypothetical protein